MPKTRLPSSTKASRTPNSAFVNPSLAGSGASQGSVEDDIDLSPAADADDDFFDGVQPPKRKRAMAANGSNATSEEQDALATSELVETDLADFFGSNGPLSDVLEGYELRPSQLEMAQAVKRALLDPSVALIEAPTG